MTDEQLARLLTEHLPPIPPEYAQPPRSATELLREVRARRRTRRRLLLTVPAVAALFALFVGGHEFWLRVNAGNDLRERDIPAAGGPFGAGTPAGGKGDSGGNPSPASGTASPSGPVGTLGDQPTSNAVPAVYPLGTVDLAADGRTLRIPYSWGGCRSVTLAYRQNDKAVILQLTAWNQPPGVPCATYLRTGTFALPLAAPLGKRPVLDDSRGQAPVTVRRR
jgi:hypothetical protein